MFTVLRKFTIPMTMIMEAKILRYVSYIKLDFYSISFYIELRTQTILYMLTHYKKKCFYIKLLYKKSQNSMQNLCSYNSQNWSYRKSISPHLACSVVAIVFGALIAARYSIPFAELNTSQCTRKDSYFHMYLGQLRHKSEPLNGGKPRFYPYIHVCTVHLMQTSIWLRTNQPH